MNMKFPNQPLDCFNFIDGNFVKGKGAEFKILSPYNQQILGIGHFSQNEEINNAIVINMRYLKFIYVFLIQF